jgi:hypothetical protein
MEANMDVRLMVYKNRGNTAATFPTTFSEESALEFVQADCVPHKIDSKILAEIAKHLRLSDLSAFQQSCKYFEKLAGAPVVLEASFMRSGLHPLPESELWWGQKRKPHHFSSVVRMVKYVWLFLGMMCEMSATAENTVEYRSLRETALIDLDKKFGTCYSLETSRSTKYAWAAVAELMTQHPTRQNARFFAASESFWEALGYGFRYRSVLDYLKEVPSMVNAYIAAFVLGNPAESIDFSSYFFRLLHSRVHVDASAALAAHFGAKRLQEMDFKTVADVRETLAALASNKLANHFDLDGIWQGVMHYYAPPFEDKYGEEMVMNLKFPRVVPVGPGGPEGFEMIGKGVDSLGEFEIEEPLLDGARCEVKFTKLYRRPTSEGGVLRHVYEGTLYPCGMGGFFGLPATEEGLAMIGFWFIGRPRSYIANDSELWDRLVAEIQEKASQNEKWIKAKVVEMGREAALAKLPNPLAYEIPIGDQLDALVTDIRSVVRYQTVAACGATSISELRYSVDQLRSKVDMVPDAASGDVSYTPFDADNEAKATLRTEIYNYADALLIDLSNRIIARIVPLIPGYLEILESRDCDPEDPEVKRIVKSMARLLCYAPQYWKASVERWLATFKNIVARQQLLEQQARRSNGEDIDAQGSPLASDFVSQLANRNQANDAVGTSRRGKKGNQNGFATSTLLLVGTAAVVFLAGAFALLGRRKRETK